MDMSVPGAVTAWTAFITGSSLVIAGLMSKIYEGRNNKVIHTMDDATSFRKDLIAENTDVKSKYTLLLNSHLDIIARLTALEQEVSDARKESAALYIKNAQLNSRQIEIEHKCESLIHENEDLRHECAQLRGTIHDLQEYIQNNDVVQLNQALNFLKEAKKIRADMHLPEDRPTSSDI